MAAVSMATNTDLVTLTLLNVTAQGSVVNQSSFLRYKSCKQYIFSLQITRFTTQSDTGSLTNQY